MSEVAAVPTVEGRQLVDEPVAQVPAPKPVAEANVGAPGVVQEIKLKQIDRNPQNPRRHFDEEKLLTLVEDLKHNGLLQPLTVRPLKDERFELVMGERRFLACQRLGVKTVRCVVRKLSDRDAFVLAYAENDKRVNLSPIEDAKAFQRMYEIYGMSLREIGETAGKSHQHIKNRLQLLALTVPLQTLLDRGAIDVKTAEDVAKWDTEKQDRFLEEVCARTGEDIHALSAIEGTRAVTLKKAIRKSAKPFDNNFSPSILPEVEKEAAQKRATRMAASEIRDAVELLDGKADGYAGKGDLAALAAASLKNHVAYQIVVGRLLRATEFLSRLREAVEMEATSQKANSTPAPTPKNALGSSANPGTLVAQDSWA